MINLKPTWRWFGPKDPITLQEILQTGATGIVTALHHIPNGSVWKVAAITQRKQEIEAAGLEWSVIESLPVHEDIKTRSGKYRDYIENYKQSIRNISKCGLRVICYNFMPVLDWTRTNRAYPLPTGQTALRLDMTALATFDIHILKRKNAGDDYSENIIDKAAAYFQNLAPAGVDYLTKTIIAGLPGAEENYSLADFRRSLLGYSGINAGSLKVNLFEFLKDVIPVAEENGILMCIHPDDPPFSLLGLPRIVSSENDIGEIYSCYNSISNGLTFCTGSLGANRSNSLVEIIRKHGDRIHFAHLRNIKTDADNSFYESGHLTGDVDMYSVLKALTEEQIKRAANGRADAAIPFRPDHGLTMLDDHTRVSNPGYPLIGRLTGLAEIRGMETAIKRSMDSPE